MGRRARRCDPPCFTLDAPGVTPRSAIAGTDNVQINSGPQSARRATVGKLLRKGFAVAIAVTLLGIILAPGDPWPIQRAASADAIPRKSAGDGHRQGANTSVIVQAVPGHIATARQAVLQADGRVDVPLPLVDGFEATLPREALERVAASAAVRAVTPNSRARFADHGYGDSTTASNFARTSGATTAWEQGTFGGGVGVAVIDTGVSPTNDLAGRLMHGPDLSGEGSVVDTYGHGTVMAGIIGGSGADSHTRAAGGFHGVAPESTIVSIKVAGRNGAVDVSTMLQAMHWVAAYKDQYNLRVLNLSWGTRSAQDTALDPLNYAVQRLWQEGIVVVTAAGNSGPRSNTVTKPGDDPMVVTVGSYDDKSNRDPADDSISAWSSRGPTGAGLHKPDIVAPGRSLVAVRSHGSDVEANNPKALISPTYIKGSGTSQATAVVSGLAALLIEHNPSLTPDQVKRVLTRTASPIADTGTDVQGAGRVRVDAALSAAPGPAQWQTSTATGRGLIDASRGDMIVASDCDGDGTPEIIQGEIDVRCEPWDPDAWTGVAWTDEAWTGQHWPHSSWSSAAWNGVAWTGGTWTGVAWTGVAWTGVAWTESKWSGVAWTGSTWSGVAWTGSQWSSAEYEEADESPTSVYGGDAFLTAFWGNRPPPGSKLPGERAEPRGKPNDVPQAIPEHSPSRARPETGAVGAR
ncbi:MAG: S8 family serine peptidase [Nitriliruptorales bacterium]|nr:S8 family serine peptidase [Nitriliruptorales bacterium]